MAPLKHALISGYYGFGNAGDEAILAGLVEGFRKFNPRVRLTALSRDPDATRSEHQIEAISRGMVKACFQLHECDLLINGGGGLIQDVTSSLSPFYYLSLIGIAQNRDLPVAFLAQGVGPLRGKSARWLAKRTLSRAAVLTVRDRASYDTLVQLGVTREIIVTADLAFALPKPEEDEVNRAWEKAKLGGVREKMIGVALRRPLPEKARTGSPESLAKSLATGLNLVSQEFGLRPVLIPMHHPRDLDFIEQVAQSLPGPTAIVHQQLSARELLALCGNFELVLAMRLHALIFAAICGVPCVAISYDPKVDSLMTELEMEHILPIASFSPTALVRGVQQLWSARDDISRKLRERSEIMRTAALHNIELVLPLLAERR